MLFDQSNHWAAHTTMRGGATIRGLCEVTLEARDPDALARFYSATLGLPILSREPDRVWLACGPRARLGLWTAGPKEFGDRGGRHVHFALSARPGTLVRVGLRAHALGATVQPPVEHDGGDRSLYFEDPEGNVVEVWDFFERGREVEALADGPPEIGGPEVASGQPETISPPEIDGPEVASGQPETIR